MGIFVWNFDAAHADGELGKAFPPDTLYQPRRSSAADQIGDWDKLNKDEGQPTYALDHGDAKYLGRSRALVDLAVVKKEPTDVEPLKVFAEPLHVVVEAAEPPTWSFASLKSLSHLDLSDPRFLGLVAVLVA